MDKSYGQSASAEQLDLGKITHPFFCIKKPLISNFMLHT